MVRQDDRFDHVSGKIFKGLQTAFEQVRFRLSAVGRPGKDRIG